MNVNGRVSGETRPFALALSGDGRGETVLPAKVTLELEAGEGLRIETPGGGGWGDGSGEG